jgi:predicted PurR-regulated permease PerM
MAEEDRDQSDLTPDSQSPLWNRSTKIIVVVSGLILIAGFALRFQVLLLQIAAAGIIAYVVTPVIDLLSRRTPLSRNVSILVVYSVVVILLVLGLILLSSGLINQIANLIDTAPEFIDRLINRLSTTPEIRLGPYTLEIATYWEAFGQDLLEEQLLDSIGSIANRSGRTVLSVLGSTLEVATIILFTTIISIYMAVEVPKLGGYVERAAQQPGYQADARRINREFSRIWRAYLRGQITLGIIIFLAVWLSLSLLGVQNAFGLGVLSGVLEFLPFIGPLIGTGAAAISALLQPSNYLGVDPWVFALIVIGAMFLIQQIENNVLVPRIVGGALDLNPLIVIIGVFIGASLAGLVGAVLAAPLLATTKLLGTYAWRKLFDLPPFPEPEIKGTINGPPLLSRATSWFTSRSVRENNKTDGTDSVSADQELEEKSDS